MTRNSVVPISASAVTLKPVVVNGRSFALNGANVSYRFHVDEATGDLISDHFGGIVTEDPVAQIESNGGGWSTQEHLRRELPDLGRGDFRVPALRIKHDGHTVTHLKYDSYTIVDGKPGLPGLPSTFGKDEQVTTLVIRMCDSISSITADVSYSIFPKHDAIARSVKITNNGQKNISIEKLASFSVDFHSDEYEMLHLQGEWARECSRTRRKVDYGLQGFGSTTGYSSHYNNPFLGVVSSGTTESYGDAWGFSLIYTGSFKAEVERAPQGLVRALIGMNPDQLSWPLKPGESLASPECVAVFSGSGIGSMSRKFHRLFRQHLITSKFVNEPRPTLLNSWEGLYFDYDEDTIYKLAQESADLGAKLFVLDDGWFGVKYPRDKDDAGLGDWDANPAKFPGGLKPLADKVIQLESSKSSEDQKSEKLRFGLWFEPEMVNPRSALYEEHPDWALHAGQYGRSETRNQLVLNVALPEVQDYIIESVSKILRTVPVTYIKWDNNRAMHESPSPANYHAYILGLYRILNKLTTQFPNVLWEGCAAGGGRFDPGILHYFPQVWTSDNQDALDRIHIQFGTSVVYPASTMGAHIAAVPCEVNGRVTPIRFRAHVAMMGGSFGLELNPATIPPEERSQLPELIALSEKVNPIVVQGDMYRLRLPEHSNHPTAMFLSEDGSRGVLFAFQILVKVVHSFPMIRLQGLDPAATYKVDGNHAYSGATLMNGGIQLRFKSDFDSKVVFIERL